MKWEEFHDDWWDERRQPQPGDLETAWDALWEAMPSGWTVGKPQQDLVSKQWTASIVLVTGGTSRIGHMPKVVSAQAPTEATMLVELARCLVAYSEGRVPK
ncbi:MAG: hypothetical protein H0V36_03765 [Chloroflexi bacterium]|nr:hypothetical protein [Chloroflexota bacterium]